MYRNKEIFCGHFFGSAGPKGVINDWRRFKLDNVDQTVPQSKRELLRQMSSPREDDKERLNRKVDVNMHRTLHTEQKHFGQMSPPIKYRLYYKRVTQLYISSPYSR